MDRLYVTGADQEQIGFWDLAADEPHPETPEHLSALTAAVVEWKHREDTGGEPAERVLVPKPRRPHPADQRNPEHAAPETDAEPSATARPWLDLATNSAGASARAQARLAREAALVKTFLARALCVHTDERAWRIGADGEEKVASQLARAVKKDQRWRILHAVPVGDRGSDIDHIVIGPGGVFTINTKHHPGATIWAGGNTFHVNGSRQYYVRNSRHEATRAARLLASVCGFGVHFKGLIVTVNTGRLTVKAPADGVRVVDCRQLAAWLGRLGDVLSPTAVDAIYAAARRSMTWRR